VNTTEFLRRSDLLTLAQVCLAVFLEYDLAKCDCIWRFGSTPSKVEFAGCFELSGCKEGLVLLGSNCMPGTEGTVLSSFDQNQTAISLKLNASIINV
jgi:hypothetical protein